MGQLDIDPETWPDPAAMNKQLHADGRETRSSASGLASSGNPAITPMLEEGLAAPQSDGKAARRIRPRHRARDIDTTNPEAARMVLGKIRDNHRSHGFDYLWLDETEPDLVPVGDFFSIGSGDRFTTSSRWSTPACVHDGFRKDAPESRRVMILARAAYLGAQRNGASSGLRTSRRPGKRSSARSPTGLNFTATGMRLLGQ